jgi:hypothetical protein
VIHSDKCGEFRFIGSLMERVEIYLKLDGESWDLMGACWWGIGQKFGIIW